MSFGYQMLGFGGGGTPTTPIDTLLATALARYTADDIVGTFPVTEWTNSGTGGASYDLDTVVGTAANLITLESHMVKVTYADYLSTPDSAANSFTGDFTVIGYGALADWGSTGRQYIAGQFTSVGEFCWAFATESGADKLYLVTTSDGTVATVADGASNASYSFANGSAHWIRVTYDISANTADFYTSGDAADTEPTAVSWTQLGTSVTITQTSLYDSSGDIQVGDILDGGSTWGGKFGRVVGIKSTDPTAAPAWDCNPADASPNADTWTSSGANAEVWTIEGDAVVNTTDYDAVYAKGSVGIETTTEQAIADPMTIFMVLKQKIADPSATEVYFNAKSTGSASIGVNTEPGTPDKITLYAGSNIYLAEPYQNALSITTIQHNGDATTKLTDSSMGSVTGDAGAYHLNWGTLFSNTAHTVPTTGAMYEFIVFDSALSDDDVALVQDYLETKYELANAETLLATALAHYTPADIVGTFPVTEWTNSGTGGTDYDLDTVNGTAANLFVLPSNTARRDSTSGNYFSTPDSADNSVSSAFTIIAYASFDVWDTGTYVVAGKYGGSSDRCYRFYISGGQLTLTTSTTGSDYVYSNSTSATGFSNGTGHWIRVTFDNSANTTNFYTSDDAATTAVASVSWAQLGSADISHVVGTLVDSSHEFEIGSDTSGTDNKATGNFGRVVLLNSTDPTATPVLDFNPADATANTSTWVSSGAGGETWTIQGDAFVNTTDYAAVYVNDDVGLETTAGQTISSPGTVFMVFKYTEGSVSDAYFLHDARSDSDARWKGINSNPNREFGVGQGSGSEIQITPAYDTDMHVVSEHFNGDATTKLIVSGLASVTGNVGSDDWDFATFFTSYDGPTTPSYNEYVGAMWEIIVFDSALTDSEAGTIRNHLLTKYGL